MPFGLLTVFAVRGRFRSVYTAVLPPVVAGFTTALGAAAGLCADVAFLGTETFGTATLGTETRGVRVVPGLCCHGIYLPPFFTTSSLCTICKINSSCLSRCCAISRMR